MDESTRQTLMSRRNLLTASAVGAGAVWVAPVAIGLGMTSANAASGPADRAEPPRGPGNNRGQDSGNNPGKGNKGN